MQRQWSSAANGAAAREPVRIQPWLGHGTWWMICTIISCSCSSRIFLVHGERKGSSRPPTLPWSKWWQDGGSFPARINVTSIIDHPLMQRSVPIWRCFPGHVLVHRDKPYWSCKLWRPRIVPILLQVSCQIKLEENLSASSRIHGNVWWSQRKNSGTHIHKFFQRQKSRTSLVPSHFTCTQLNSSGKHMLDLKSTVVIFSFSFCKHSLWFNRYEF